MAARRRTAEDTPVPQEIVDRCLAFAVAEGDIVNFRFLFFPYSPLRHDSTEDIETPKYAYLHPVDEDCPRFREALARTSSVVMHDRVQKELDKKGPAQLPAELVLLLADNAVRLEKYTAASQAYELLRIRRRMMEEFFVQADKALDEGDLPRAVRGYRIATGLEYDYAAFPEPLPAVPNYQSQALMLHAEYPRQPEDSVALQLPDVHVKTAIAYLLLNAEAAARLEKRSLDTQLDFVAELIRQRDPNWPEFAKRYVEACAYLDDLGERWRQAKEPEATEEGEDGEGAATESKEITLADEIEQEQSEEQLAHVPELLLGRSIPEGEWWQYLKDLAYTHPASVLFIARQMVSKDIEILVPRYHTESPLVKRLGLAPEK